MTVIAPYKEKAGSESIQLSVDTALFASFPKHVTWNGVQLAKKDEFHVMMRWCRLL